MSLESILKVWHDVQQPRALTLVKNSHAFSGDGTARYCGAVKFTVNLCLLYSDYSDYKSVNQFTEFRGLWEL